MIDAGLILYVGLLVLLIWRFLSGWRLCGAWMEYANYCILLYVLLMVLNVWAIASFLRLAALPEGAAVWADVPHWLKPMMLGAPIAAVITYVMAFVQTGQHVDEIRRGAATLKHDRAVQIIALPAVFGCMAMTALAKMYESRANFNTEDEMANSVKLPLNRWEVPSNSTKQEVDQMYLAQIETCFHVADVYEAWALFQFVKLTLDILRSSLKKISEGDTGADAERREVARGLLVAHKALDSITYTGVVMFLVVCVGQAGWALYRLTFTDPALNGWESYNNQLSLFKAAGFIASAAAIYNVHIVESEFHCFFVGYSPLLKFVTVKILLSLAFFQAGAFYAIQTFNKTLPNVLQDVSKRIPFVADILQFNDSQFYLFYSSLILYECVLGVLLHLFAWSSSESFYLEHNDVIEGDEEAIAEKTPLVDKTEKTSYSSWLFG